jgi:hypothetical protein
MFIRHSTKWQYAVEATGNIVTKVKAKLSLWLINEADPVGIATTTGWTAEGSAFESR